jgi:hypothetical protein
MTLLSGPTQAVSPAGKLTLVISVASEDLESHSLSVKCPHRLMC